MAEPVPDLVATTKFFAVVRSLGIILVVASIVAFQLLGLLPFNARPVLLVLVPAYFVAGFVLWWIVRRSAHREGPLLAQLVLDATAITAGMMLTGGTSSPFLALYFVAIISASLVSLRGTVIMGAFVLALYGILVLQAPLDGNGIVEAATFTFIFVLVAFQSAYLVGQVRKRDAQLAKQKEDFLFRTVHDIRTPSTIIRYAAEIIRDAQLPPEMSESLDDIEQANQRINGMVSDLMKIARGEAEAGITFQLAPVHLEELLPKLVSALAPVAADKGITLEYVPSPGLPPVLCDAVRLEEALSNLVDNAIKYNRPNGRVTVASKRAGGPVSITIQDTGIGIDPKNLPNLFTPYFREQRDPAVAGTGLGLFAVRKLVEGMGGRIAVTSVPDVGTTFTIELPVAT